MKLWMVIYVFGVIHGSVGPLAPFEGDMEVCMAHAAVQMMKYTTRWEELYGSKPGALVPYLDGRMLMPDSLMLSCERHDVRPQIEVEDSPFKSFAK